MQTVRRSLIVLGSWLWIFAVAAGQNSLTGCDQPAYSKLDFWVGHWHVYVNGKLDGAEVMEKILNTRNTGGSIKKEWAGVFPAHSAIQTS